MATYLYGLALASSLRKGAPLGTGVAGSAVATMACGELSAIVSEVARAAVRPSLDTINEHDQVLQRLVDEGQTIAAVRFGQTFDDEETCRRNVAERADRLVALLRDQADAVEMRVLMPATEPAGPTAPQQSGGRGPGRAYLESLRAASEVTGDAGLRVALGPLIRAERVERLPQSRGTAYVHLVSRTDLSAYRDALAAMPAYSGARVVGPLPFYSFAEPGE